VITNKGNSNISKYCRRLTVFVLTITSDNSGIWVKNSREKVKVGIFKNILKKKRIGKEREETRPTSQPEPS
jgi:hypothetical protein